MKHLALPFQIVKKDLVLITFLFPVPVPEPLAQAPEKNRSQFHGKATVKEIPETQAKEPLSITRHLITLNGKDLHYTAKAGYLPTRDDLGKLRTLIFFVAYEKDRQDNSGKTALLRKFRRRPERRPLKIGMVG